MRLAAGGTCGVVVALVDHEGHVAQIRDHAGRDVVVVARGPDDRRRRAGRGGQRRDSVGVVRAEHPGAVAAHRVAREVDPVGIDLPGAQRALDQLQHELLAAAVGPAVLGLLEHLGRDHQPAELAGCALVLARGRTRVARARPAAVHRDQERLGVLVLAADDVEPALLGLLPEEVAPALLLQLAALGEGLLERRLPLRDVLARKRRDLGQLGQDARPFGTPLVQPSLAPSASTSAAGSAFFCAASEGSADRSDRNRTSASFTGDLREHYAARRP